MGGAVQSGAFPLRTQWRLSLCRAIISTTVIMRIRNKDSVHDKHIARHAIHHFSHQGRSPRESNPKTIPLKNQIISLAPQASKFWGPFLVHCPFVFWGNTGINLAFPSFPFHFLRFRSITFESRKWPCTPAPALTGPAFVQV